MGALLHTHASQGNAGLRQQEDAFASRFQVPCTVARTPLAYIALDASRQDSLAEWSKALASGASPQGRGFEPHSCHHFLLNSTRNMLQENEGREIRTPNLLIWSQTRCRCAIAPLETRRRRRSSRVPHNCWTQWAAALMQRPPTPRRGRRSRKAILKGWTQWDVDLIKLPDCVSSHAPKRPDVRRGCKAAIAQLAARRSHNPKVVSSILTHRNFHRCVCVRVCLCMYAKNNSSAAKMFCIHRDLVISSKIKKMPARQPRCSRFIEIC